MFSAKMVALFPIKYLLMWKKAEDTEEHRKIYESY